MVQIGLPAAAEQTGEFGPGVRRTHVDDPNRLDAGPRRLGINQVRPLPGLDAAPEYLLGRDQDAQIQGIKRHGDLDPFAASGDNGQHRGSQVGDPLHVASNGFFL
jgi:hypothetical protein